MSADTEVAWRVNVWRDGAWHPWSGSSGDLRLSGAARMEDAERSAKKEFDRVAGTGRVVRLSIRHLVLDVANLATLDQDESQDAFWSILVRSAAAPCSWCDELTTFLTGLCGGGECAA